MVKTEQKSPANNEPSTNDSASVTSVPGQAAGLPADIVETTIETAVKNYGPAVAIGVCIFILGIAAVAFLYTQRVSQQSGYWDSIDIGVHSDNVTTLVDTAASARGTFAGAVAMHNAGVVELNAGLSKMVRDRAKAKKEIASAIEKLEQAQDSPEANTMLEFQNAYSLAYAYEALGDFAKALPLYEKVAAVDSSPYQGMARDGASRCNDPSMKEFYAKFNEWKPEETATAPGDLESGLGGLGLGGLEGLDLEGGLDLTPPAGLQPEVPATAEEGSATEAATEGIKEEAAKAETGASQAGGNLDLPPQLPPQDAPKQEEAPKQEDAPK